MDHGGACLGSRSPVGLPQLLIWILFQNELASFLLSWDILLLVQPNAVKLQIEGSEYTLFSFQETSCSICELSTYPPGKDYYSKQCKEPHFFIRHKLFCHIIYSTSDCLLVTPGIFFPEYIEGILKRLSLSPAQRRGWQI